MIKIDVERLVHRTMLPENAKEQLLAWVQGGEVLLFGEHTLMQKYGCRPRSQDALEIMKKRVELLQKSMRNPDLLEEILRLVSNDPRAKLEERQSDY